MATTPKVTNEKIEERKVRHTFDIKERTELGSQLARALNAARDAEAEFESVKAAHKARIAALEADVNVLSTDITNGFTMRMKRCRVVMDPKNRKKSYFPEVKDGVFEVTAVLIEDMTQDDYAAELFEAESVFERRAELKMFEGGVMVLGRQKDRWYSALRVTIGKQAVQERLSSEGKKFKTRIDAIKTTAARLESWLLQNFGDESAKGFRDPIAKVIKAQEGVVE